jgi:hypothetical protein
MTRKEIWTDPQLFQEAEQDQVRHAHRWLGDICLGQGFLLRLLFLIAKARRWKDIGA